GSVGSSTINNSGTLAFDLTGNVTQSGVLSGSGALDQEGSAPLILSAANTYSGGTNISAGTVQVTTGGSLGTGNVTDNSALVFNHTDATTVGSVISGSGTLTQSGTGTLVLTGANTYSGATNISSNVPVPLCVRVPLPLM